MTSAQNRILPLPAQAATADSAAADAYISGQSHSIKKPSTKRTTAIASEILLMLAFIKLLAAPFLENPIYPALCGVRELPLNTLFKFWVERLDRLRAFSKLSGLETREFLDDEERPVPF